jgi:hypothetical protein
MTAEWTQEAEQDGENRSLLYGDTVAGAAVLYGSTYTYGDTVAVWTQESESSPTVTEA